MRLVLTRTHGLCAAMWFGQLLSQVRDMLLRPLALIGALCLNLTFFTQAHATDAPLDTAQNVAQPTVGHPPF